MDLVYSSAVFTIVAAAGMDADAGLPGLSPQTVRTFQQEVVEVGGLTIVPAVEPADLLYDYYLEKSKWSTRGWTFQERLLSPRILVVSHEQVYWECTSASWCEETVFELADTSRFSRLIGEPTFALQNSNLNAEAHTEYVLDYGHLVLRYTQRELSRDEDALNAFSGILSALEKSIGESYHWALPISTFDQSLWWDGGADGRRLEVSVFPTWSWLAWKGEIYITNSQRVSPVVKFYNVEQGAHYQVRR